MIILSRSRHLWSVAVHQCYGLWQKLLKMIIRQTMGWPSCQRFRLYGA
ncbi:hypothetical protein NC651_009217 [Populus alba x Populus x berolinensis]|nr:hypothetical protein NC651_009217 [Populus alba x Populus x berolinensis]